MAHDGQQRIQYCGIPQCKICRNKQLDTDISFYSNLTKKGFHIEFSQNCKTNLVIYLISCKHPNCCLKYTGRTHQAINRRLSLHRANIIAGTEGPAMLHHFTKVHQPSDMIIKAIEICAKTNIKERERFWIAELNTAFPYGLNDRINVLPIKDAYSYTMENTCTNIAIYETFNKSPSRRTKRGGSRTNQRHTQESVFNPITFMDTIYSPAPDKHKFFINHVRYKIMSLNKVHTKELFLHLCICINEHNDHYYKYNSNIYTAYLSYLARDITFAKLKSYYTYYHHNKNPQHFIVINFCNKLMDTINFNKIIRNIIYLFPQVDDTSMKRPTISFKYSPTIKSKINNYRQVINQGITPIHCDCNIYDNKYKIDNHVFTGNLDIVCNAELRLLMRKGLNFREIPTASKSTVYKSVVSSIDSYIYKTSERSKIPQGNFKPWKLEFLKKVQHRLDKLYCYHHNHVLSKQANKNELKKLQDKWVFTSTDKASNNITIVCKKHYMDILDQEIYNSGNFVKDNNLHYILDNQTKFLNKFKLITDKKMPFLYWTAKLHKNPYSYRFITSGRGCAMQPLSIKVSYCLKTVLKVIRSNAKFRYKRTNINHCFIIDNRNPVTNFIKQANQNNYVHSVSTFDFKTLYTSIPHDKLKNMLSIVIKSTFKSRNKKFISVTGKKAFMCDERKSNFTVNIDQLIECINFIIDQSYIVYKGEVFRQCIGIPMGTNCAPYIANLFLHAYEDNFIDKMVQQGRSHLAERLVNIYRYQDDCIVFNDQDTFLDKYKEIYPEEMVLEKTNSGNVCTFLDLAISIEDDKFTYHSYDKRLDFNFDIINYPDLKSNIPYSPSYGVFNSQLVRFCDINYKFDNFYMDIKTLVSKLIKQNFDMVVLKAKFRKFYANNILRWSKFGSDINNVLQA